MCRKSQVPWLRHSNTSRRCSLASPSISVTLTSIQNRRRAIYVHCRARRFLGAKATTCVTSLLLNQTVRCLRKPFPLFLPHFYRLSAPTLWYRKSQVQFSRHPSSLLQILRYPLFGPPVVVDARTISCGPKTPSGLNLSTASFISAHFSADRT